MSDLFSLEELLKAYDAAYVGPPGGARKLIEEAPAADVTALAKELIDRGSVVALFFRDKTGEEGTTALHGNGRQLVAALSAMWGSMAEEIPKKKIKLVERELRRTIRAATKMVYKKLGGAGGALPGSAGQKS